MDNQQKQIILQMRKENRTYAEIAEYLCLPLNTVKSVCYRSRPPDSEAACPDLSEPGCAAPVCCKNCGTPLLQPVRGRKKIFCSSKCRYDWWNRHRVKKIYHLVCKQCGREFVSYGNRKRRFCSRGCYQNSRHNEELGSSLKPL